MKFNTVYLCILICPVLLVNKVYSESGTALFNELAFPLSKNILLPVLAIPPPAGILISSGLSLMQMCLNIFIDKPAEKIQQTEKPLSKADLIDAQAAIIQEIKTVDSHLLRESERIIRELTMSIETNGLFEDMRQTLDYLNRTFADRMKILMNSKLHGIQKHLTIQDMLNYSSEYRSKLRSFINKFIQPNTNELSLLKPVKLFFEHVSEIQADKDDDCSSASFQNKIYKSFVYILKVLTEGYAMAVSVHVMKYQEALKDNLISDADELKENAIALITDYNNDIESLIAVTKRTIENASTEIRNCGKFKLEEGKTFERVSFSHIYPKISALKYIDVFYYECRAGQSFINITNYEIGNCSSYSNYLPFGSQLLLDINLKENSGDLSPYINMKAEKPDGTEEVFGHSYDGFAIQYSTKTNPNCYTTFCPVFKKKSFAISTQRVTANPGNVITGLRFRVKNRVIYIDIQQGKYINQVAVDPKTVFWTETPESKQIAYLSSKLRKIELGDFVLKNNRILTSIRLKNSVFRNGLISVLINGLTLPYMNNTAKVVHHNVDLELNQLELVEADDPLLVGATSKNIISKPPVPGKRYFVSFQPSDIRKDFGRSTLPLLDIREVVSNPPAPLTGLGLYHEGVNGSGGLIALKLITPNLTSLLTALNNA